MINSYSVKQAIIIASVNIVSCLIGLELTKIILKKTKKQTFEDKKYDDMIILSIFISSIFVLLLMIIYDYGCQRQIN